VAVPGTAQMFVCDRQNWNFSEKGEVAEKKYAAKA